MRSVLGLCLALSIAAEAAGIPKLEKRLFGLDFTTTSTSIQTTRAAATGTQTSATATSTALVKPATKQKATQNAFWQSFKARGVNLGNWLVLESWMDPVYYSKYSSTGTDEWTFCQTLGSECESVLSAHWDSWINETDISQLAGLKYNLLRIPIGHWALVPTTGDEPYVHSTQMQQVERIMSYANKYGMYVVLDLHGLPGSQNGKDHSGHVGDIEWFSSSNQKRSLTVVAAAMNFIYSSPNKAVIAALEIMNEPNITTSSQQKTYEKYISESEKMIHSVNATMPIMFHDAFKGAASWTKFTSDQKKNYVIDVHEYYSGTTQNAVVAVKSVCQFTATQKASKSKTPVFVGEFSVSVGGAFLDTVSWRQEFYETQVKGFSANNLAGSAFWSIRAIESDGVTLNDGWSLQALINSSAISTNTWDLTNTISCPTS